jgi:hypothetical protein
MIGPRWMFALQMNTFKSTSVPVTNQNDSIVMHKVKKLASRALIVVEFVCSASIISVLISGGDAE